MNQHNYLRDPGLSSYGTTVTTEVSGVKRIVKKFLWFSREILVAASFMLGAMQLAHAEDARVLTMRNSVQLLNFLWGVIPQGLNQAVDLIQKGTMTRITPKNPVWVINTSDGTLLYYQGQKNFVGQKADRLVDDKGFRFGERALAMASNSHSTWVKLSLAGKDYAAYCAARQPFVVCTLME
ncbi:hypothetical protein KTD31_01000 [Burkholderia multivorans]|uniref:hypothetical protein n=1 Tax=Burkholderia multivorans TaxID=87883 RepID=UPI001C21D611|nr:hypothetical protein [Burkholderia multivorans]MBU9199979.1 hypothetical protein [Burkholderia multivorans]MDN8078902.1 hypothetical protein [Burkholderia multivorans]